MSTIKQLIKSSGIYFIGDVLAKMIQFILLPLFTIYILPEDYGYYAISISFATCGVSFLYCNMWYAMLRYMFDYKENKEIVVFNTGVIFATLSILLFIVVSILFFFDFKYLLYIGLYAFSLALRSLYSYLARGFQRNKLFVVSGIISTIVNVCLNILMIKYLSMGIEALYISSFISFMIQVLIIDIKLRIHNYFFFHKIDKGLIKNILVFSYPFAINTLIFYFMGGYTNYAVMEYLGLKESGLVAMASKFAIIIQLASSALNFAWQELTFERESNNNTKTLYSRGINYYMILMGVALTIILPLASIAFPFFIKGEYTGLKVILPIFFFSAVCSAFSDFIGTIILSLKKTKFITITTLCSAITNVILCKVLIPEYGVMGAGMSIVLSYLVSITIRFIYLTRRGTLSFKLFPAIVFIGCSTLAYYLYQQNFEIIAIYFVICFIILGFNYKKIKTLIKR